jgi:hypothetical protein
MQEVQKSDGKPPGSDKNTDPASEKIPDSNKGATDNFSTAEIKKRYRELMSKGNSKAGNSSVEKRNYSKAIPAEADAVPSETTKKFMPANC